MAKKREGKGKSRGMLVTLEPDAAGVDIGAEEIYIAVPVDRDESPVRCFGTFTRDLYEAADWLRACRIRTVAMESTSVYWIPFFQILEERGFSVFLVNAQHVRNVPGRKSDVSDCQWIQYLHSAGLLRASFRPPAEICAIRSLWRHRESLIQMASQHTMHIQKALSQMNLQIHHVLSEVTGVSGLAILDAILSGERDPMKLASLCNWRVRSPREVVAKALVGDYRPEHLFTLRQSLRGFRYYQLMIAEVDQELEKLLRSSLGVGLASINFWIGAALHNVPKLLLGYFRSRGAKPRLFTRRKMFLILISAFTILSRRLHILQVVFPLVCEIEALV